MVPEGRLEVLVIVQVEESLAEIDHILLSLPVGNAVEVGTAVWGEHAVNRGECAEVDQWEDSESTDTLR